MNIKDGVDNNIYRHRSRGKNDYSQKLQETWDTFKRPKSENQWNRTGGEIQTGGSAELFTDIAVNFLTKRHDIQTQKVFKIPNRHNQSELLHNPSKYQKFKETTVKSVREKQPIQKLRHQTNIR